MFTAVLSQNAFFVSLSLFAAGAFGSLLLRKNDNAANWWGNLLAIAGAVSGLVSSSAVIFYNSSFSFTAASSLPLLSFSFNVDKLSAFFIFTISLIALIASIYGMGYAKHFYKKYNLGSLGFFYNAFIAGMLAVVSSSNAIFFLIVWEIMSLASYFLVIYENKEKENIKAGSLYFIMTHAGTAFIALAFLLLYSATGSFDFMVMKHNAGSIAPLTKNIIFILALIGFGTKAGIIPFHIWLPSAHPAAPSHVSALMSGVMIKTGIYMMIRIFMDIMPGTQPWWGALVLAVGAVSSLLGVLYALTEHDIKKLLAYHSIENIGIILLGLGSSLLFLSLGFKSLAMIGLVAALFHTFNHAIFKALLFLGAGSVISKTHTRNMEEYGGLIKRMPQTAVFFLVGSMAISALPPFNGFFSEWLTFQSLFSGIRSLDPSMQWMFILAAGSLAFTGGLAAACFVKAFGATFLGRPRSEEAEHAKETDIASRLGMSLLAILTLVVGFFAGKITGIFSDISGSLDVFRSVEVPFSSGVNVLRFNDGFASISMPFIFGILIASVAAVFAVVYFLAAGRKVRIARTWDCGTELDRRMEITATGFSRSIITIFSGILRPTKQIDVEYHDADMRYFPKSRTVKLEMKGIYNFYLYRPIRNSAMKFSGYFKMIQSGNVNSYIAYMFLILIILLLSLAI
ncbi:MAG TPA: hydrogenase 4 subunit B [Candidatus Paceibacterota bacterium]|nr:hydrogenase 4 subunit B [Candidatus Paceibacterota bacterium]